MDMNNKIYVSEIEYGRLCRVDGRMDALMDYINHEEQGYQNTPKYAKTLDIDAVKAIIGMLDE